MPAGLTIFSIVTAAAGGAAISSASAASAIGANIRFMSASPPVGWYL